MRRAVRFPTCLVSMILITWGNSCRVEPPSTDGGPSQAPVSPEDIDFSCALVTSCAELWSETAGTCASSALTRPGSGNRYSENYLACLEAAGADCPSVNMCSSAPSGSPCETIGEGSFCDGEVVVSCFAGSLEYTTDCSTWDLPCFEEGDRAMCQGDGPSCLPGSERCDGADAILCMGFREATFDCIDFVEGRSCEMVDERAQCVASEADCDPQANPTTCVGNDLEFCSASGNRTSINCRELGFEACIVDVSERSVCGDAPDEQ